MLRVALVGCGAIAAGFHAPALRRRQHDLAVTCVDPDRARAQQVAAAIGADSTVSETIPDAGIAAAIVATPAHVHAPIVLECLRRGIDVLCEKPLAATLSDVAAIRAGAVERGRVVAVNQTRRFIPACAKIRTLLQAGAIGSLESVEIAEGDVFDWPAATPAMFGARSGGRGVLLDIGVHVIDLLNWWLPGPLQVVRHRDDSFGGSEASVVAEFASEACRVTVRLSWLAKQPNRYVFRGSHGSITWGVYDLDRITVRTKSAGERTIVTRQRCSDFASLADAVLADFLDARRGAHAPMATPDDAMRSMALIEACYARRERLDMPWHALAEGGARG